MYGLGQNARSTVREAYLQILGREPDYPGAQGYVDCLEGKPWQCTEEFVRSELLNSAEYKQKQIAPVAPLPTVTQGQTPLPAGASYTPPSSAAALPISGSVTVAGMNIPYLWIGVGLLALMLLKRK